ncbi:MAG TPA: cytochrome c [Myxococcales bacterium]|nr:cytochrome c [Myxococcales bacterium]
MLLCLLLLAACGDTTLVDPMERQPKFKAFAANPQFEDGRAMRDPPAGTVPRERIIQRPELTTGKDRSGQDVKAIPIQLTPEVMQAGRERFDIYCSVCHGLLGDGVSLVSTQMSLRPPPSLHKLRSPSPAHVFQVVTEGFGLMASYAPQLTAEERWAVVAYVEALRRSQAATLGQAPADVQKKLAQESSP